MDFKLRLIFSGPKALIATQLLLFTLVVRKKVYAAIACHSFKNS